MQILESSDLMQRERKTLIREIENILKKSLDEIYLSHKTFKENTNSDNKVLIEHKQKINELADTFFGQAIENP